MTLRTTLDRVLDAVVAEAPAAAPGRRHLDAALAWTATTGWPEAAWRFSVLADGAPVELVWRPGRPGLFWTAEPAAPELCAADRLTHALALVEAIEGGLGPADAALARRLVAASAQPWPVWVAGRFADGHAAAKLYLLCDGFPDSPAAPLLRGDDRPTMVGLTPSGEREYYWTRPQRQPGDRWRLGAQPGLAPLAEALDAALADWTGAGLDHDNGRRLGLSARCDPDGKVEALAAFIRSGAAGGAALLRDRLLVQGGSANPALADCWAAGDLRPMLLSIGVAAAGSQAAIGLRVT